ncbi:aminomethyl-transferring glycine dehydrogenase subunit GcvPB [Candidatus Altiarchaeota archaeon]
MRLLFEKSVKGRSGACIGAEGKAEIPKSLLRKDLELPELTESDVIRHYTALASRNYGIDTGFYPLGSCTMKYNPKVNDEIAGLEGFTGIHPYESRENVQGALKIMHELGKDLEEITGMDAFSLQPAAGAHGELTGIMIIKAYHGKSERDTIIIPDSAHGTNPASAAMCGYKIETVGTDPDGCVDIVSLAEKAGSNTAGLMLTNPNTLGLWEDNISQLTEIIHDAGGLTYYDGANLNAIMGKVRPGDMGFDVMHVNLHKTFATPHGGGGPGSGPVGVKKELAKYLPAPVIGSHKDGFFLDHDIPESIGRVRSYYGNFLVLVRAYAYIRALGGKGLRQASEEAVLNANYLKEMLKDTYDLPFDRPCMHEFVISARRQKHDHKVKTLDIAKRILDHGMHAPTIYFPLIIEESMMVEPTETESKQTLDEFIQVMKAIDEECAKDPETVRKAPHNTPVGRLDDTKAAREPDLRWGP